MRLRSLLFLVVACACAVGSVLPALAAAQAADGASRQVDPALQQLLEAARPLDDVRTDISENEPEYCSSQITSEINPNAANRNSIEVGPPKFLVEGLEAGSAWRHCVSIHNRSPDIRTVALDTLDVVGSLDPDVRLETRRDPVGVGAWITPALDTLELQPGERVLVPYLVEVPQDPPGGTVTGGVAVTDTTGADEEGGGARITRSLVVQLQATFPGGVTRPLEVSDLDSTRLVWSGRDPDRAAVSYTLSNVGEVVDTAAVELRVDGLLGREVATVRATPEVLIPRSAQEFRLVWRDLPWIGVYRVTLEVTSTDGTRQVDLPRVWILPPWWVIVAFVAAVALFAWGVVRRRRAWQQYLDEAHDDEYDDEYEDLEPYG